MSAGWWKKNAEGTPNLVTKEIPGPESRRMHQSACRYFKGLSSQVTLFPVCFKEGCGITLTDVDGNRYLDFSSGIYVTSLGHSHPKIAEAISYWAGKLLNCHDFTTPVKEKLLEKLVSVLPKGLNAVQFYSDGSAAVEAGIRAARAINGRHEFISCYQDFHGKSMAAVSCAQMVRGGVFSYGPSRAPGFYMVPRPNPYRPTFAKPDGTIDTNRYLAFYNDFITEGTVGNVSAFVLEPAQGWAGSIFPPDDFFPKLRAFCDQKKILLFSDEVLAGMGRTGEWVCLSHWNVVPDIITFGKSFGNGFPVTAMVVKEEYAAALNKISASSSYGGNPMACAAALASIEVIEEEGLLENVRQVGAFFMKRMQKMKETHPIMGTSKARDFCWALNWSKTRKRKSRLVKRASWFIKKPSAKDSHGFPPATSCACPPR